MANSGTSNTVKTKKQRFPVLSYLAWELTNAHYNIDVGREGVEYDFHLTWYDLENRLFRIYDKDDIDTFRLESNITVGQTYGELKDKLEGIVQKEPTYKALINNNC